MKTSNSKFVFPLIFMLLGSMAGSLPAQEEVFKIPPGTDMYCKSHAFDNFEYIRFGADGTYTRAAGKKMAVAGNDSGTWNQDAGGVITLTSKTHYRDIESGTLKIAVWDSAGVDRLPALKQAITDMLAKDISASIATANIEAIEKYGPENRWARVSVDFRVESVPREQLAALILQIDKFTAETEKNLFHLTPMSYKGITFLLWKDSGIPLNRNLAGLKECIDNDGNPGGISFIFQSTDKDTFDKETSNLQ